MVLSTLAQRDLLAILGHEIVMTVVCLLIPH